MPSRKKQFCIAEYKLLLVFFTFLLLFSCNRSDDSDLIKVKQTKLLMDTFVEITIIENKKKEEIAKKAIKDAFFEMSRIEQVMSSFKAESDISKINKAAGGDFQTIDDELYQVIKRAIHFGEISQGTFDISTGILMGSVWQFNEEKKQVPSDDAIKRLMPFIDYRKILLGERGKVRLQKKGMKIDVGGLAKGYAVDRAVAVIQQMGIKNALINAGGDLKSIGQREPGKPWRVGIQHPRNSSELFAVIAVTDSAIATSGDYQRYFEKNGIRYHHILDPETGWPASRCQSVTIVAKEVIDADALATAVFVMEPEKGKMFIEKLEGVEGIIISKEGKRFVSSGLVGQITFSSPKIIEKELEN